jgi:cytochrome b pre-mRNA-processing protein 3
MLQALIDFFFADIEERLRSLLGKRISERTITGYMKEYRELWNGSQLALDVGLVGGDWELGGAVWRNLFDAKGWDLGGRRGEDGQLLPSLPSSSTASTPESSSQALGPKSETNNAPESTSNLPVLPEHIYTLTAYLRRELKRLEEVPDEEIIRDGIVGEWGSIVGKKYGDDIPSDALAEKELQEWHKRAEQIGIYR